MKRSIIVLLSIIALTGLNLEAWAYGNPPAPSCQVNYKPGGDNITGTVVATVSGLDGVSIDAILRLEYKGKTDVFRVGYQGTFAAAEGILCDILASGPTNNSPTPLSIAQSLGLPPGSTLVITGPAVPGTTLTVDNPGTSVKNTSFGTVPGSSFGDQAGLADVRVFIQVAGH